jgi:hypothetical protein
MMDVAKVLSVAWEMADLDVQDTCARDIEELLGAWEQSLREAVNSANESTEGADSDMVAEVSVGDLENQMADVDARCDSLWQAFHELTDRIGVLEQKKRNR